MDRRTSVAWAAVILAIFWAAQAADAGSAGAPASSQAGRRPASASQALALYRKSLVAADRYSYAGRQYITTWSDDGRSSTVVAQVYHAAPDQFLLRFLAPRNRAGRAILENASFQWTYIPDSKVVVQAPRPIAMRDDSNTGLLQSNYSFTMGAKPDLIADRETYVVTLTSKSREDKALRFWIDPYTGLALRSERYHAGGNLASVSYFSEINYHPKFTAGTFAPTQWRDVRIDNSAHKATVAENLSASQISTSLQGRAIAPKRIREYRLVGVTRMEPSIRPTLHLHYSDGLSSLSLFETLKRNRRATRMAGSRPVRIYANAYGRVSERFSYSLLNWDSNHLSMTLLGDLSPETLVDLATALTPPPVPAAPPPPSAVRSATRR